MTSLNSYIQNNPPPQVGNSTAPTTVQKVGNFLNKNVVSPIKNAFTGGVNEVKSGFNEAKAPASNPLQAVGNLVKGGAHMAEGAIGAIASPFAPVVQRPLGAGVNAAGNALESTYGSNVERGLYEGGPSSGAEKTLGAVNTTGNIIAGVAGLQGGAELASNIWNKAYTGGSSLDMATAARETAAQNAVKAGQDINSQVGGFKAGLGDSFGQAPKVIEQTNPNLKVTLPNDIVDRLNILKDTKKFALPDYLRTASPEYGSNIQLGDIEKGGISLSPSEAQDLITKLNKLTYAAKASGDLEVNQSTIGLNKDIHSLASDAFSSVKDPQGQSVWNKAYENYAKGATAVDKLGDIVNTDKNMTASDFNNTLNNIIKLSKTPEGKISLQNALNDFKETSGIDLSNPTAEISKILDSEEFLKEAQKPSFLSQTFNKQYMSRTLVRIVEYAVFGTIIRNLVKSVNQ